MTDFFKYLTPGTGDRQWGIYLSVVGKVRIPPPATSYPGTDHPSGYYFTWERGRVLNEFQVNYITRGAGIYETETARYSVRPGSLLITRPGTWHRYRPVKGAGWTENYVGFDGSVPRTIFSQNRHYLQKSVLHIGHREEVIDAYHQIFSLVQEEKPGFQQVAAGMVMKLLGYISSMEKQRNLSGRRVERIIREACFLINEDAGSIMDFKQYAAENHIGYSYFRKMFKQYTGNSPVQYHLDLKIRRAREMLVSTDQSIKKIAFELGFGSIHYFSRVFKNKTGAAPSEFRKNL